MEQIVYLDPDDDIRTIRDRLEWAEAPRVLLVVPRGHRPLRSAVNMRLLARQGSSVGREVILVTRDRAVTESARHEGLAAFATIEQGQKARSRHLTSSTGTVRGASAGERASFLRKPRLTPQRNRFGQVAVGLIVAVMLVVLLGATALLVVPEAEVILVLASSEVNAQLTVTADTAAQKLDAGSSTVPAREVRVEIQGKAQTAVTSKKDVPDEKAKGKVAVTNRTREEVTIPRGMVVATSSGVPVRFQIAQTTTLAGEIGSRAEVEIVAQDPGPQGNVPPFMINRMEGILGARIAVVNDQPTTGGSLKQASVVSAEDRTRVRSLLLQRLQQEGIARIKDELQAQEFVALESVALIPLTETYDKFLDEAADQLELTMRVVVRALAVSGKDANLLVVEALEAEVPGDMSLSASSLQFQVGEIKALTPEKVAVVMYVRGLATAVADTQTLTRGILGKPVSDAVEFLKANAALAEPPVVRVTPTWMPRVPVLPLRIHMQTRSSASD